MKILLVGEVRPTGYRGDLHPSDAGSAGARLCSILGMTTEAYLKEFDRVNLCRGTWDDSAAWVEARRVMAERRGVIVLLGRKVQKAFGVHGPLLSRDGRYVLLPHPSGKCRVWNDPDSVRKARELVFNG